MYVKYRPALVLCKSAHALASMLPYSSGPGLSLGTVGSSYDL